MHRFLVRSFLALAWVPVCAMADSPPFSGTWSIDLRSSRERNQNEECGSATFILTQKGNRVVGDHQMATVGCGRVNAGGDEAVKGVVVGNTAVLVVTSGRNGAVVMGRATLKGTALVWDPLENVAPGDPPSDAPLILGAATLRRVGK